MMAERSKLNKVDELKPCPFCGGKMKFIRESHINKRGREITNQYYMHGDHGQTGTCILDEMYAPFIVGAGDANPEEGYIGEYAEMWNRRVNDD